jgi:hypothetical protein
MILIKTILKGMPQKKKPTSYSWGEVGLYSLPKSGPKEPWFLPSLFGFLAYPAKGILVFWHLR